MRYTLLASAGLAALCAFAIFTPAAAADCGCAKVVGAALAKEKTVESAPLPAVKPPAKRVVRRAPATVGDCGCAKVVGAALAKEKMAPRAAVPQMPAPAADYAESGYDYGAASAVDTYPYTHHWTVAPQGYVPPPQLLAMAAPPPEAMMAPPDEAPMAYADALAPPDAPPAYGEGDGDSSAHDDQAGITVDQDGWIGGVGYARAGGGGGGGGGGMSLTVAQPDSLNGPSYNSFGQSYGGDYQSANKVDAWRTQALTPPASTSSGSGSK